MVVCVDVCVDVDVVDVEVDEDVRNSGERGRSSRSGVAMSFWLHTCLARSSSFSRQQPADRCKSRDQLS
jgi:hypothetical protein